MTGSTAPTRRAVLQGASAAVVAGVALTACGDASDGGGATSTGPAKAGPVGKSADVPVGGGTVFASSNVVVTQPTSGDFKGFNTRCTHQGCAVSSVADGYIICPCHNSRFAVGDGAPTADSMAKEPLASVPVSVANGEITVA
ncbi:Rieske (2Fe-2S) protein [Angustibacter luteus]|uniref:Rieske (2Fe-2S) protein n=1 Tax=Angustibacter luteus TaxID=658456 RepID=A0ABW1JBK5_9ACTN